MKIIFLHGLESTPKTSSTAKFVKANFDNVLVPDYKPKTPYKNIKKTLTAFVEKHVGDEDAIVIGISLGGFWALHLTEFTKINKVILINPAITKSEKRYGIETILNVDVCGKVFLNKDDDVVDNEENFRIFHNRFSVTEFETGSHRATNQVEMLPHLKESVEFLTTWVP